MTAEQQALPISSSTLRRLAEGPSTRAWLARWARGGKGQRAALMQPLASVQHLEKNHALARDISALEEVREAECEALADGQPLAPYSAAAVAAMLSLQGLDEPTGAWKLVPEGPHNHLLAMAGQLRPIELPKFDPPLRRIDLALAGAAIDYLSLVDLTALGWLIEAAPASAAKAPRKRAEPHMGLAEAVLEDLWAPLLPSRCSRSAGRSCHSSLSDELAVIPRAGGSGEANWQQLIWNGWRALPPNVGLDSRELASREMLQLLAELAGGALPERGRHSVRTPHEDRSLHEIEMHWGPWISPGTPEGVSMLMLVRASDPPVGVARQGEVHIAFARRER